MDFLNWDKKRKIKKTAEKITLKEKYCTIKYLLSFSIFLTVLFFIYL